MSESRFLQRVEMWLTDAPGWPQKVRRVLLALWHNKVPRKFRLWGVAHWLAKTAVASSAPAVAYFFNRTIPVWAVITVSVLIFAAHSLISLFDQMSKAKKEDLTGSEGELAIRFGEIIASFETKITAPADTDDSIRSALGVIEIVARRVTKSEQGTISVALATYNGGHAEEMKIRHRNPGNTRPIGRKFPTAHVLGHHACKAGTDPRVVHDLRWFGKEGLKSPTQSSVTYRSMFLIPISQDVKGTPVACGFISIDSTKPYAFYGNRDKVIIVTCEAFIDHIQSLIRGARP